MSENFEQNNFEEMMSEEMLDQYDCSIRKGDKVTGKVLFVKENEIAVNLGGKSDGVISKEEFSDDPTIDLTKAVSVGDDIEVKVIDYDGVVYSLSFKRLQADRASKILEEAFESKAVLTGKVTAVVKGGMTVSYEGCSVFVPASLASDTFEKDLNKFLGQEVEFVLIECDAKKRRTIGDCKQLLVAKKDAAKKALFEKIAVGDKINGTVKNVTDFGVFVDIGGVDGLLHNTEMTWKKIANPKDLYKTGDSVEVMIKSIDGDRIALTRRFPDCDPWANATVKYAEGTVVTGKVARMTDFGAFVELEEGVDALLHVSQIAKNHVNKPSDVLTVGQEVEAAVISINAETKKISISIKALLQADEIIEEEIPVNAAAEEVVAAEAASATEE